MRSLYVGFGSNLFYYFEYQKCIFDSNWIEMIVFYLFLAQNVKETRI